MTKAKKLDNNSETLKKNATHTLEVMENIELQLAQLLEEINTGHPRKGVIALKLALLNAQAESLVPMRLNVAPQNHEYLAFLEAIDTLEVSELQTLLAQLGTAHPISAQVLSNALTALNKKRESLRHQIQLEHPSEPHARVKPGLKRSSH